MFFYVRLIKTFLCIMTMGLGNFVKTSVKLSVSCEINALSM